MRTRVPNNFERGGTCQTAIRDNKTNVEWFLKQILNAFKLLQHRFNFDSTCFNTVQRGGGGGEGESSGEAFLMNVN